MRRMWGTCATAVLALISTSAGRAVVITTTDLPNGTEMVPFIATLEATNGTCPYRWGGPSEVVAWGFSNFGQTNVPSGLSNAVGVAAGYDHSLAVRPDGTVVAWGNNDSGQTNVPSGLSNAVGVAAGSDHSLAVRSDGTVVAWGDNADGQTNVPSGLSNAVGVAAGWDHSLAVRSDGTVAAWGNNGNGQTNVPASLSNVVGVAAGGFHNLALRSDGTIVAWGYNADGETNVPSGLSNAVGVAAGLYHSIALQSDGRVMAWGRNNYGQTNVPTGLSNVVGIAAARDHNLALKSDGTIVMWGYSGAGLTNVPSGLSNVVGVAAGGYHSIAMRAREVSLPEGLSCSRHGVITGVPMVAGTSTATFVVWDASGAAATKALQMFIEPTRPMILSNSPPAGAINMAEASNQVFQVWATDPQGSNLTYSWTWDGASVGEGASTYNHATAWGDAGSHTLRCYVSDGLWTNVYTQWAATVLADYDADGMPDQWEVGNFGDRSRDGSGDYDGDGASDLQEYLAGRNPIVGRPEIVTDSLPNGMELVPYSATLQASTGTPPYAWSVIPQVVAWGDDVWGQLAVPLDSRSVADVAAGRGHCLALRSDGTVVAWGNNEGGQGDVPAGLGGVVSVAAGFYHNLALRSDGTVAAWGYDDFGQTTVPLGLTGVVWVAGGGAHSLAVRSDGTVVGWGNNEVDQISVPADLSNVVAVAAGGGHSLALRSDGTVMAWGYDFYGQTNVPTDLSNVVGVAAGTTHSLALRSDGTVVAWGQDSGGPVSVPEGLSNVVRISAGEEHSLALLSDGTVVAWGGYYDHGQTNVPAGLSNVVAIAAGGYFSLALLDGSASLPEGLACSADGVVSGVPTLAGTSLVTFVARDADGAATNKALEIVIEPSPNLRPAITSNSPPAGAFAMAEATNQLFQVWASDPEGSNVTYSWTWDGQIVGGGDSAYTHAAVWGDSGWHTLRCCVSDGLWTNIVCAQWDLAVLADYDGDGLPDEWEVRYFGDRSRDGTGNFDGDRLSDLEELRTGHNPTVPQSPNDDFASAFDMGAASHWTTNVCISDSILEPDEGDLEGFGGASVWFQWQAPQDGFVLLDTCGSAIDTVLAVFEGTELGGLWNRVWNDDYAGTTWSRVGFWAWAGNTYRIAVHGYHAAEGDIVLSLRMRPPGAPENDDIEDAIDTGSASRWSTDGTNIGASLEEGEPDMLGEGGASVWYRWEVPYDGWVTIDTAGSDFDTVLVVGRSDGYLGPDEWPMVSASNDNDEGGGTLQSRVTTAVWAGETCYIAVHGKRWAEGHFNLNLSMTTAARPDNDDRMDAVDLGSAPRLTAYGSNVGATSSNDMWEDNDPTGRAGGSSVWFSWRAPSSGDFVIDTFGSDFDTVLRAEGGSYFANDDDGPALQSRVGIRTWVGNTWYFAVDGYEGPYVPAEGDIVLHISKPSAPSNDNFTNAIDLGSATNVTIQSECFNTTLENDEPYWSPRESGTAWWRWQAPVGGVLVLERPEDHDGDPVMDWCVFTNSSLPELQQVLWPDSYSTEATIEVVAGAVYQIALSPRIDYSDDEGNCDGIPVVHMDLRFHARPPNDDRANATDLGGAPRIADHAFSNIGARGDEDVGGYYAFNGVWFRWQAPADAAVGVDIDEVEVDGGGWWDGPYVFAEVEGVGLSRVDSDGEFSAVAGATYYILFGCDDEGTWELDLVADARPPNDGFPDAFDMGDGDTWLTNGTLRAASFEPGEINPYYQGSVWYAWQAGTDGRFGVTALSADVQYGLTTWNRDAVAGVAVYAGSNLTELASVANGFGQVEFDAIAGTEYRIAVSSAYDWTDDGDFLLGLQPVVRPSNDDFANAASLGSSTQMVVETSNLFGTTEADEYFGQRHSMWWCWQAPADGAVGLAFSLRPEQVGFLNIFLVPPDLEVAAFTGSGLTDLTAAQRAGWSGSSGWAFRVNAGTNYWIAGYSEPGPDPNHITLGDVALLLQYLAPPANDDFADAADLGNGFRADGFGDNLTATTEADEPEGGVPGSVWWRWQAPADGLVEFDDDSDDEPNYAVLTGTNLQSLVALNMEYGRFEATAGATYYIRYSDGWEGPSSDIDFDLELIVTPANNDFANAGDLGGATNVVVSGNFLLANQEEGEPMWGKTVWWRWQAPTNGTAWIEYDGDWASLGAYTGTGLGDLSQVAWEDDDTLEFQAVAGMPYWIAVAGDSWDGADGDFELSLQFWGRPVNDDFADAIKLGAAEPVSVTGHNGGATREMDENGNTGDASIWWRWHAPSSGHVTIDCGSRDFEVNFDVFTGQSLGNLYWVADNEYGGDDDDDDERRFPGEGQRIEVEEGVAYSIAISKDPWDSKPGGGVTLNIAYPPINDDLARAIDISAGDCVTTYGDNFGASGQRSGWEGEETADNNVWWQWKAPRDGGASVETTGTDFGHDLRVFVKDPHSFRAPGVSLYPWDLVEVRGYRASARDGAGKVAFRARASEVYYISVEGKGGERGNIALRVTGAPPNDNFAGAAVVPPEPSATVTGRISGATSERGEPLADEGQSAWWTWQAPASGLVSVDTFGSDFDTVLTVYTGTNVAALARRRCCDDAATNGTSRARFFVEAGSNYHFRVHGRTFWEAGDVVLNVATIPAPVAADDHVIWGRAYLEERTGPALALADAHFAQALALDGNHAEANLLRGVTRFAMLQQEPEFQSLLDSLGVVTVSNDIYHARYDVNADTNGVPLFAAVATTGLPMDYVRTHVEPRLEEVRGMWDRVTDPAFWTSFSDAETGSAFVQMDYGDALMLKGLPSAAKAVWTLVDTYNLQASLDTATQMMRDGQFDAQHVVDTFQQMLEFRSSGRREEFKSYYLSANQAYQSASGFIRNLRATVEDKTHLFSLQRTKPDNEQQIRENAQKAADSLNGAVVDIEGQQIAMSYFVGTTNSLRDFLPDFVGNKVVAFSTPDVTFGGTWRNGSHTKIHDELRRHDLLYELSGFSAWAAQHLAAAPETQRTRGANPDNDPINNLMEYAFNLDPMRVNVAAEFAMPDLVNVTGVGAGQYLALTFARRIDRPDLRYVVAVSDDLVTWDRTESQVEQWGDPIPTGDGVTEQVTYRLKADVAIASKKFLRLEIIEVE